ncbi:exopolysaccharide biosynthesis protein [Trichothermofontia sp.]
MAKLSKELQRYFFEEERPDEVTLNDILELAGERTFGFLLVLLALPSALPVPAPGYSTPFGFVIFLLAVQLMAGSTQPWLPGRVNRFSIPLPKAQALIKAGIPWLQRIEVFSRPRLTPLCTSRLGRMTLGGMIALMACSMMLPIPLTNTLPAMGIFITGFGLLDDDGVISLAGLVVCLLGLTLTTSVLVFGVAVVKEAIGLLKQGLASLFR